jgi:hypothetical protein
MFKNEGAEYGDFNENAIGEAIRSNIIALSNNAKSSYMGKGSDIC